MSDATLKVLHLNVRGIHSSIENLRARLEAQLEIEPHHIYCLTLVEGAIGNLNTSRCFGNQIAEERVTQSKTRIANVGRNQRRLHRLCSACNSRFNLQVGIGDI